jgi:pyrroline-5-carboxylate reductase
MGGAMLAGWRERGLSQAIVVDPFLPAAPEGATLVKAADAIPPGFAPAAVVLAIKPQEAAATLPLYARFAGQAVFVSVMAGKTVAGMRGLLGDAAAVVRAMPNTPALVGLGQTGLYARGAVGTAQRQQVEAFLQAVGQSIWVSSEDLLDAVTAVSGSGPAYVFYVIEAMVAAGVRMGLTPAQAHQLAVGTMVGAAELARASSEAPAVLRERVTSKGGTTHAAISSMQADGLPALFEKAMVAARDRAVSLGDELGSA